MAVSINCIPVQNYSVSSKFGMRGSSFHYGLDMPGVKGSNIYAAQGGVVKYFGNDPDGYGNYIILEHQRYKFCTLYAHLSVFSTSVGSFVTAGDVIGKMGSTGRSTGSHLHFEIRNVPYSQFWSVSRNTNYILNPQPYLENTGLVSGTAFGGSGLSLQDNYEYTYERVIVNENSISETGNYLYGRKYRIMVFREDGTGLDLSDLHIVFDVSKEHPEHVQLSVSEDGTIFKKVAADNKNGELSASFSTLAMIKALKMELTTPLMARLTIKEIILRYYE